MNTPVDLGPLAREFQTDGEFAGAMPIGSGHIHDSYRVSFRKQTLTSDFVLQRINTRVFNRPAELMENLVRITAHLQQRVQGETHSDRRALRLVAARNGGFSCQGADGSWWRMFKFIPGARAYEAVTAQQAYEVARGIGRFQAEMATLGGSRLNDTIPNFHNTPLRLEAFERAVAADAAGRARNASSEIAFAFDRREVSFLLERAGLPERVVHNDAKSSNVLLDESTGKALCVIDLDTVMAGLAAHDFGDMVRSMTSPAPEDEQDLSRVFMQFEFYEALLHGYLSAAKPMLTKNEVLMLPDAGKVITYENGLRFLADYLSGDTYYKTDYPEHNLHRCRTQFKLMQSIDEQYERMRGAVAAFL